MRPYFHIGSGVAVFLFGFLVSVAAAAEDRPPEVAFTVTGGQDDADPRRSPVYIDALDVLTKAKYNGVVQVGGLNVDNLLTQAHAIKFRPSFVDVMDRNTAAWEPGRVYYNPNHYVKMSSIVRKVISTHEVIGASCGCYVDDGYSLSLFLVFNNESRYKGLLDGFRWPAHTDERRHFLEKKTNASGGGATVVGGGGDGRDVELKLEAIENLLAMSQAGHQRLLDHSIADIFSGILLVNFYRSARFPQDNFNLMILNGGQLPVVGIHPETFNALYALSEASRTVQLWKLGALYSDNR